MFEVFMASACFIRSKVSFFCLLMLLVVLFGGCDDGLEDRIKEISLSGSELTGVVTYWRTRDLDNFDVVVMDFGNKRERVVSLKEGLTSIELGAERDFIYSSVSKTYGGSIYSSLVRIDAESGNVVKIKNEDAVESKPRVSPDFVRLAYNYRGEKGPLGIKTINLETEERSKIDCPGEICMNPKWISEDELVFVSDKEKIYRHDLVSGKSVMIFKGGEGDIYSAEIISDSGKEKLVFSVLYGTFSHPSGSSVFVVDLMSDELREVIYSKGEITSVNRTLMPNVVVFPLSSKDGDGVYVLNIKTKEKVSISEKGWFLGDPSWSWSG